MLRKTVTVLSHCLKRTRTLTQNCLLGAYFDVCVQLHNKAQVKAKLTIAQVIRSSGKRTAIAEGCAMRVLSE
jgi:hypothetical protein